MSQVTIKDIARGTGYSGPTVSRVLSGSDYPVRAEVRQKIEQYAKDAGYVPNLLARGLKTSSTTEVAVVIPSFNNPFYTSVLTGIEDVLWQKEYTLLVYLRKNQTQDAKALIQSIYSKKVAGIIIAADCINSVIAEGLIRMKNDNIPVVVFDDSINEYNQLYGVFFDYYRGGWLAAEYLYNKGHRKVALITRQIDRETRRKVANGVSAFFAANDCPLTSRDIYQSTESNDFSAGVALAKAVLESGNSYTAMIANNDAVASGALSTLLQYGVNVPNEMSIIGMDNSVFASMTTPLLTTVQVPSLDMGNYAANLLLDTIEGSNASYSMYLQPKMIERNTVAQT